MNVPLNAGDSIVITLIILGIIFIYAGLNTDNLLFIIIGVIELILSIIQIYLNKNPVLFE